MFNIIKSELNDLELSRGKEILLMTDKNFMRVEDVARELDVSKSYAYKIVQKLNKELEAKGYITITGRVNREYFNERVYSSERPVKAPEKKEGED